jgi:hypothetical protein
LAGHPAVPHPKEILLAVALGILAVALVEIPAVALGILAAALVEIPAAAPGILAAALAEILAVALGIQESLLDLGAALAGRKMGVRIGLRLMENLAGQRDRPLQSIHCCHSFGHCHNQRDLDLGNS